MCPVPILQGDNKDSFATKGVTRVTKCTWGGRGKRGGRWEGTEESVTSAKKRHTHTRTETQERTDRQTHTTGQDNRHTHTQPKIGKRKQCMVHQVTARRHTSIDNVL